MCNKNRNMTSWFRLSYRGITQVETQHILKKHNACIFGIIYGNYMCRRISVTGFDLLVYLRSHSPMVVPAKLMN